MKLRAPQLDVASDEFARRQDRFLRACGIMLAAVFIASTIAGFDIAVSHQGAAVVEAPE